MLQKPKWLIFTVMAIAQFMVVLDVSITNVALPAIKESLHFSDASLSWIITAYALAFGGFLLLGGRAADLFGRKRMLLIGMVGFTITSLLIGLSQSAFMLIALRAVQGISGALMIPAALSVVLITFTENSERNRALGFWTLVSTGGAAMGLLLGGVLTQFLSWHWNFFINVPIGIAVIVAILKYIPEHEKESKETNLDLPGAVLVTGGLIALVYGLTQAPVWGWTSGNTLATIGGSLVLIALFVYNESRSKHPLVPLSIFKNRNVSGANLMMAPMMAGLLGMFFLSSLYIQAVLHYSPVITGLAFLPFPIILGIASSNVAKYVSKYGYKPFLILGPLLVAIGMGLLARLPVDGNYFKDLLPTFVLMPIGVGITFMPVIAAATSGVKPNEAGLASGLINTSQQMGGALGLAVLSGVAASATAAAKNPHSVAALVHGYNQAFITGVVFVAVALVIAATVIKQSKREANAAPIVVLD